LLLHGRCSWRLLLWLFVAAGLLLLLLVQWL
jgi:hypothetical protein